MVTLHPEQLPVVRHHHPHHHREVEEVSAEVET
jgi:hypothetical protein